MTLWKDASYKDRCKTTHRFEMQRANPRNERSAQKYFTWRFVRLHGKWPR